MKITVISVAIFALLIAAPTFLGRREATFANAEEAPKVDKNVKGEDLGSGTRTGIPLDKLAELAPKAESLGFQAEVSRLMGLIINSLYSNRDVFLRELISNASDALDKIRFESLSDEGALGDIRDLEIRIRPDPENNLLHISDTGVGMTKDELIANLGTIAKSGTKEFLDKVSQGGDASHLIGQFGVGFYSAFLVADEVIVTSKNNNDDQHVWTSDASTSFKVVKDPRGNTLGRGTVITLKLKDDAAEYLEPETIKSLVRKYSEFINFPIYLWASHQESRQVLVEEEDHDEPEEAEEEGLEVKEEEEEEEKKEPRYETVTDTVWAWERLNKVSPIWTRDPKDISDEEYKNFYKSVSKDEEDPLSWAHFKAEGGNLDFKALLFIPSSPPSDAFNTGRTAARGVKLYVKRVYITDDFDLIIPKYLNFIKGVVDSDDLPLNVSREVLQQNKSLKAMEKKLVRKAIAMIQDLAQEENTERYDEFWEDYKLHIKLGVVEDHTNRPRLSKLLRYYTSSSTDTLRSLDQYIADMREGQDKIYFLAGEDMTKVENSPLTEAVIAKGYEVLYMTDPLDEYVMQHLTSYEGKQFFNLAKSDLDLGDEDKESEEQFKVLTDFLKNALKSKITKAVVSHRLRKTPSAIVASGFGYTPNMERIIKAQALATGSNTFMSPRKVLEVNPKHPIVQELLRKVQADESDPLATDLAGVLYDTAALHSGFSIEDPAEFANRIHKMIKLSLGLDAEAEAQYPEEKQAPPKAASSEGSDEHDHDHDHHDHDHDHDHHHHDHDHDHHHHDHDEL